MSFAHLAKVSPTTGLRGEIRACTEAEWPLPLPSAMSSLHLSPGTLLTLPSLLATGLRAVLLMHIFDLSLSGSRVRFLNHAGSLIVCI